MANRLNIKEIRERKNLTQDDIVRLTGIPKRSYNDYESGKTDIPASRLESIASALDVTVGTIFGFSNPETRDRYVDRVDEDAEFYNIHKIDDSEVNFNNEKESEEGVPFYDLDFTASFLEIENSQATLPDSYITHPFFKGCNYVVRASGQSMAKVICHGDAIGLIKVENWREFFPFGEIYAIVTKDGFRMIKIITKGQTDDTFTIISKPTYSKIDEFPPQQIKISSIVSIFKVQASSHLF